MNQHDNNCSAQLGRSTSAEGGFTPVSEMVFTLKITTLLQTLKTVIILMVCWLARSHDSKKGVASILTLVFLCGLC